VRLAVFVAGNIVDSKNLGGLGPGCEVLLAVLAVRLAVFVAGNIANP
jgi:hypothetical protein